MEGGGVHEDGVCVGGVASSSLMGNKDEGFGTTDR